MPEAYIAWKNQLSQNWKIWKFYNSHLVPEVREINRRLLPTTALQAVRELAEWAEIQKRQNYRSPIDLCNAGWRPGWVLELLLQGKLTPGLK
ncbi:hypothetical protein [Acetobacter estunensis]|uniref:hypothetical protein n=1 Tax=Acetobacter estunensis TaxID=104097 RepID=UPI001C2D6113|nr:hypothetical protein [Acetobacter estunensis]MBV1838516.1 hypothetical protein [Acetobacter estunensis]